MQDARQLACFVLHARPLRETSLLADLLTPDHSITRVVARGARSPRSRIRPLVQPFRPLLVSWTGRRELKTLTGLEEQGRPYMLNGLELASAYYLNELLLRLMSEQGPNPTVFSRYAVTLQSLADNDRESDQLEIALRLFELELLDALGVLPDFAHCMHRSSVSAITNANTPAFRSTAHDEFGSLVNAESRYRYYPDSGSAIEIKAEAGADNKITQPQASSGIADAAASAQQHYLAGLSADSPNALPSIPVHGETLLALAERDLQGERCLREAKFIMRHQVGMHLGNKPLQSREMISFYHSRKSPAVQAEKREQTEQPSSEADAQQKPAGES